MEKVSSKVTPHTTHHIMPKHDFRTIADLISHMSCKSIPSPPNTFSYSYAKQTPNLLRAPPTPHTSILIVTTFLQKTSISKANLHSHLPIKVLLYRIIFLPPNPPRNLRRTNRKPINQMKFKFISNTTPKEILLKFFPND